MTPDVRWYKGKYLGDTVSDKRFKASGIALQPAQHDSTICPCVNIGNTKYLAGMMQQPRSQDCPAKLQPWYREPLEGGYLSLGDDQ